MKLKNLALSLLVGASAVHASETVKGMKQDFAEVKKELGLQLDTVEKKLAELKEQAKTKGDATKEKAVKDLEESQAKLRKEIDGMKEDGKRNWKDLKRALSKSIDSLNEKIQKSLKD